MTDPTITESEIEPLRRMTDEELTTLARDIVTNRAFIAVDGDALDCAFRVVLMIGADKIRPIAHSIGAVWEFYDRAGPRLVNGYPSFFSANFVHSDDMDTLREKVGAMSLALGIPESSS